MQSPSNHIIIARHKLIGLCWSCRHMRLFAQHLVWFASCCKQVLGFLWNRPPPSAPLALIQYVAGTYAAAYLRAFLYLISCFYWSDKYLIYQNFQNPNFEKSKEMAYPNWNRYSSWILCTKSTMISFESWYLSVYCKCRINESYWIKWLQSFVKLLEMYFYDTSSWK